MWCQCARETCCDGLRGRHRRGQPPITPDVLDPCGDAWRRPSPSVALSAELSNDSGFHPALSGPEQSRYQITDVASVSRSGLCINESPSGTAVVAPWVICGFL